MKFTLVAGYLDEKIGELAIDRLERSKIGKIASRVIGSNVFHRLLILTAATITVEIFTIHLAAF